MRCAVRLVRLSVALALLYPAPAQDKGKDVCPWCKNDPKLMAAAGVVSHGPMPFGSKTSTEIGEGSKATWVFQETAHIRWAFSLGGASVDQRDKARVEAELARLAKVLPAVPTKAPPRLDPWLRLHLLAMRGEEFYARFQKLLGVTDADFPEKRIDGQPFMGNGRFLGEKDKFEILVHARRTSHLLFTKTFMGAQVNDAVRWHVPDKHNMLVSIPAEDADLRPDRGLFPHVVHNLSHLFLCAYKHFSYDPPTWLDEGLAHAMEKEINPEATTIEGEEGSFKDQKPPSNWDVAIQRIIAVRKQWTLAQLMRAKGFSEMPMDQHIVAWSMVRFLIDEHPDKFAKFLGAVKGQLGPDNQPTGKDLPDLQRKTMQELWGWSPPQFDAAWLEWVGKRK